MQFRIAAIGMAALLQSALPKELDTDPSVPQTSGHAIRKRPLIGTGANVDVMGTLIQTHGDERVLLTSSEPAQARFESLLADRATGTEHALDSALLPLLREVSKNWPGSRIELVSGFRSPKLNEMLRKKGHHVASHSQHSLGHAVDFRIVPAGENRGIDPAILEDLIRKCGWQGGVGVYRLAQDWFVHADTGPKRRWNGK